jgi:hypothetical protein
MSASLRSRLSGAVTIALGGLGFGIAAPFIVDIDPQQAAWVLGSGSALFGLTGTAAMMPKERTSNADTPMEVEQGGFRGVWHRVKSVGSRIAIGAATSGLGSLVGAGLTNSLGI